MELDIIEVRVGNYFAHKGQVKEIEQADLASIDTLITEIKPIPITIIRLKRLNFLQETGASGLIYTNFFNKIMFTFHRVKEDKLLLIINDDLRLKHIEFIHQLQNVYYDLTGDILKRPEPKINLQ